MEGNPTSRGLSGDELERQLREEEERLAASPEGTAVKPEAEASQEEAPKDTEADREQGREEELAAGLEVLEQQAASVEATVAEIGGAERVQEILSNIPPAELSALNEKMEAQRKVIERKLSIFKRSLSEFEFFAEIMYKPGAVSEKDDSAAYKTLSVVGWPALSAGVSLLTVGTGMKALVDKIKLNSERHKLRRMEKKSK